jgi:phosphoribosylanthranilate isomerase
VSKRKAPVAPFARLPPDLLPLFPALRRVSPDGSLTPLIKICGVTHPADAELALSLGADALGLNFYPKSARCLDLAHDLGWLRALPASVPRIAVLVNPDRAEIDRLWAEGCIDAFQLHGDEDEAFCAALAASGIPFIKAIRLRDNTDLSLAAGFHTPYLLLDSYHPGAYGGTGVAADWQLAAAVAAQRRPAQQWTWLSGGLRAENVAAAIRQVRPDGVDVASGVEGAAGPRRKDAARLRDFFAAARG